MCGVKGRDGKYKMARKFRYGINRWIVDGIIKWLLRYELVPKSYYLLTVQGRRSGLLRSKPVALVEEGGQRWLVAPYGDVNWVHNDRAAGKVSLSRGQNTETWLITELPPEQSGPVLKKYATQYAITQPYFDAKPESPVEEFVKEASLHPVFKLHKAFDNGD